MLLKFNVKNYKSYRNLQEFSMVSGNTKLYEERLRKEKDFSVLKFSAIYGANGAGKTNIIDALYDMQKIITYGLPNFLRPIYYKLDDEAINVPTYFETYLLINNCVYCYGFEYDSSINKLSSEWLIRVNGKKETEIYTRDMIKGEFTFNSIYDKKSDGKMKMYLEDIKEDRKKLFLSFINSNKKSIVIESNMDLSYIYDWFDESLRVTEADSVLTSGEYFFVEEKINQLAELLKMFDTGIKAIDTVTVDEETALQSISQNLIDHIKNEIVDHLDDNVNYKLSALIRTRSGFWNVVTGRNETIFNKLCFYHDDEKKYPFFMNDESEGTIRIIELAETLLSEKDNQLFVIDELDRKLHPQLTCKFIQLFLDKAKIKNNQLIVTTHESRLLDFNILRRDEIWFSNKEANGESEIYSLEEFNVRFDKKIDKAYLDGRYGGVPIFRK